MTPLDLLERDVVRAEAAYEHALRRPNVPPEEMKHLGELVLIRRDILNNYTETMNRYTAKSAYVIRDESTGKIRSDLTRPAKKFWSFRKSAENAVQKHLHTNPHLTVVEYKLLEAIEDERE